MSNKFLPPETPEGASENEVEKEATSKFIEKWKSIWGDDPLALMADYNFQPKLTKKLDVLDPEQLNREVLYEIILWKTNRFPEVSDDLIRELKKLANLSNGEHRNAKAILGQLLACNGIRLPMASTILRFINPETFQIIDDRAYRVLMPKGTPSYPAKPTQKHITNYISRSIQIYFEYLDQLIAISGEKLPFHDLDRILYQLDLKLGNTIGS